MVEQVDMGWIGQRVEYMGWIGWMVEWVDMGWIRLTVCWIGWMVEQVNMGWIGTKDKFSPNRTKVLAGLGYKH